MSFGKKYRNKKKSHYFSVFSIGFFHTQKHFQLFSIVEVYQLSIYTLHRAKISALCTKLLMLCEVFQDSINHFIFKLLSALLTMSYRWKSPHDFLTDILNVLKKKFQMKLSQLTRANFIKFQRYLIVHKHTL